MTDTQTKTTPPKATDASDILKSLEKASVHTEEFLVEGRMYTIKKLSTSEALAMQFKGQRTRDGQVIRDLANESQSTLKYSIHYAVVKPDLKPLFSLADIDKLMANAAANDLVAGLLQAISVVNGDVDSSSSNEGEKKGSTEK